MTIEIETPIIPQFVADWIESVPRHYNVRGVLIMIDDDNAKDIFNWCIEVDNATTYETLVTAYLYGYEVEQGPLHYAKIKGWELTTNENVFWNYRSTIFNPLFSRLYTDNKEDKELVKTKMSKEEWNKLGINKTNADFERVE